MVDGGVIMNDHRTVLVVIFYNSCLVIYVKYHSLWFGVKDHVGPFVRLWNILITESTDVPVPGGRPTRPEGNTF